MKRVVSISLGSAQRDHSVWAAFLGEKIHIQRIGTDGDVSLARELIRSYDGQVEAIGIGGVNFYYQCGHRRYRCPWGENLAKAAVRTPVVDGGGIKDTLERDAVAYLSRQLRLDPSNKTALVVSVLDRFGLADALAEAGCRLIIGDAMFGLGLPLPFRSRAAFCRAARLTMPLLRLVPVHWMYPTGKGQETTVPRFQRYYAEADIIAGDFHFIKKHSPPSLADKIVITSSTTQADADMLREKGVKSLITLGPVFEGRTFGANVLEGILVALGGPAPESEKRPHYRKLLQRLGIRPHIWLW